MSFGRVTATWMAARELVLRHDATSDVQRLAIEAVVFQIDALLLIVRKIYHRIHLDDL